MNNSIQQYRFFQKLAIVGIFLFIATLLSVPYWLTPRLNDGTISTQSNLLLCLGLTVFVSAMVLLWVYGRSHEILLIKREVLVHQISKDFDDVIFPFHEPHHPHLLNNKGPIKVPKQFVINEALSARHKSVKFSRADISATIRFGNSDLHVLAGWWLILDCEDAVDLSLQLRSRKHSKESDNALPFLSEEDQDRYTRIASGDREFDRHFACYGLDGAKEKAFLTRKRRASLLKLAKAFPYEIVIGFFEGKMHLAVFNQDGNSLKTLRYKERVYRRHLSHSCAKIREVIEILFEPESSY
ncbi:MAG: DUF3137 domain-containing protein [Erysipelotrichaceae bacterium]|jgi:hypothetical protein|nr:DUF3137 domain-containing protein [Erysipelotrichaceae bacterium]